MQEQIGTVVVGLFWGAVICGMISFLAREGKQFHAMLSMLDEQLAYNGFAKIDYAIHKPAANTEIAGYDVLLFGSKTEKRLLVVKNAVNIWRKQLDGNPAVFMRMRVMSVEDFWKDESVLSELGIDTQAINDGLNKFSEFKGFSEKDARETFLVLYGKSLSSSFAEWALFNPGRMAKLGWECPTTQEENV